MNPFEKLGKAIKSVLGKKEGGENSGKQMQVKRRLQKMLRMKWIRGRKIFE